MHNFAVIWLQILTLILPKIIGMNMKEPPLRFIAEYPTSSLSFLSLSKINHPLFHQADFLALCLCTDSLKNHHFQSP